MGIMKYQVRGQVINKGSDNSLLQLRVEAWDKDRVHSDLVGTAMTDTDGYFEIRFDERYFRDHPRDHSPDIFFRVYRGDELLASTEDSVIWNAAAGLHEVTITVNVPTKGLVPFSRPSLELKQLAQQTETQIPAALLSDLAKKNIVSLADVRATGGLRALPDLPVHADDPALALLEAHARLETVSGDMTTNDALIAGGIDSPLAIIQRAQHQFVIDTAAFLDQHQATQLYKQAYSQIDFLNTILVGTRVDRANGLEYRSPLDNWQEKLPELNVCHCRNCDAAVSPGAYLADLLAYALGHLVHDGASITLDFLDDNFYQPFADLPATCAAMSQPVRQVRLCVEVLRRYLDDLLSGNYRLKQKVQPQLARAEKSYLLAAYQVFLNQLGTSQAELARARTADASTRTHLAARLGIAVEHLEALILDEEADVHSPQALTEANLERIFGLPATRLVDGTLPDPLRAIDPSLLQTWRLAWLQQGWEERDAGVEPEESVMEARRQQEAAVVTALKEAVKTVEAQTMPMLRDALIAVLPVSGNTQVAKANWLAKRLLIDTQTEGCQETRRISQAIETMQGLLWATRTGQLREPYPLLTLEAEYFDTEWKWLGSYATWRAAMWVFLYPENILAPTLRSPQAQTPAFARLVQAVRRQRRFDAEAACVTAGQYAQYLRDIGSLKLGATCAAITRMVDVSCQSTNSQNDGLRPLFYTFALSNHTNTVYWSAYDAEVADQGFWEPVPGLDPVTQIIGAVPHRVRSGGRFIYLFLKTNVSGKQSLVYTRYDLDNRYWDSQGGELALPEQISGYFRAAICQQDDEFFPIQLAVQGLAGDISILEIDDRTNDWRDDEVRVPGTVTSPGKRLIVKAFVGLTRQKSCLVVETYEGYHYMIYLNGREVASDIGVGLANQRYWAIAGAVRWPGSNDVYVFLSYEGESYYHVWGLDNWVNNNDPRVTRSERHDFLPGLHAVVPTCRSGDNTSPFRHWLGYHQWYSSKTLEGGSVAVVLSRDSEGLLTEKRRIPLRPVFQHPIQLYPTAEEANRYAVTQFGFWGNAHHPPSHLTYIQEAYYFLPVFLALQLQKQGHYTDALNCFRLLYDYSRPADERKVYYGLVLEENGAVTYQRSVTWLQDPLNPHAIASVRSHSYTRYTLLALIRCLLDYADAEFTRDTAESLPRARTLYVTALELLAEEVLPQPDTCDADNGALEIEIEGAKTMKEVLQTDVQFKRQQYDLLLAQEAVATAATTVATTSRSWFNGTGRFLATAPSLSYSFCIPSNPVVEILRGRATANLYKLRHCQNIAGLKRPLEPYAAATDIFSGMPLLENGQLRLPGATAFPPTPYRYIVLIERAKQLIQLAAQVEATLLSTLEKRDAEYYSLLKARQDLRLASAGVRLQNLRVQEAENGIKLAELQRERAHIQAQTYQVWLEAGLSHWEQAVLEGYATAAGARILAGHFNTMAQIAQVYTTAATASFGAAAAVANAVMVSVMAQSSQAASAIAIQAESSSQIASFWVNYELRQQEWALQQAIAQQDVRLGEQQLRLAEDRVRVVEQERLISQLQNDHAQEVVDFLGNKFTNVELYDWMSGVLEGVYSYFLQQATAVAKLAENQLAFERQTIPPSFIQADYWQAPDHASLSGNGNAGNRRGLTGSARLLEDIYQLDQHAFETNQRKLNLSKTISLAELDPFALQQFRETGRLYFETPLSLFDRDFPGHYLRLIKQVRTSVVALIPPTHGIKATLTSTGNSRVVIGRNSFQTVEVTRGPESVALTAPHQATGTFELDPQPEMLLPFEGLGVDNQWVFEMPKAANAFDYRTIADVLITLEYTALNSFDYRQQVLQQLDNTVSGERAFSFRHEFADAWYDLHNPDQNQTPMTVSFQVRDADFPPHVMNLRVQHMALYFSRARETPFEVAATLHQGGKEIGTAVSEQGLISTRQLNAAHWSVAGLSPVGDWKLVLPDTEEVRGWFVNEQIKEILFVVTYQYIRQNY